MQNSIKNWLDGARALLQDTGIASSGLDSELLLSKSIDCSREYLISHNDEILTEKVTEQANQWLKRRLNREPLAYIFGEKEFYRRNFIVTPDTLIPRPETEIIIELFEKYNLKGRVLDVGTGTGCIGLTLKIEHPEISLTISDISNSALKIARKNAKKLEVKPVRYIVSDLLDHWLHHAKPKKFYVIVSNPPYVDSSWEVSPETHTEPGTALYADDNGLELIKKLIDQSKDLLEGEGYLILEADPRQHQAIISYAQEYKLVEQDGFILLLQKVA